MNTPDPMPRRILGPTGLQVTPIGLGCAPVLAVYSVRSMILALYCTKCQSWGRIE